MAETAADADLAAQVCEIVITAPDADWLASLVHRLVEDGLVAAGHNIASVRSIYRWRGAIYDRDEARVALHTRLTLAPAIVDRTTREHPYEVPCVVATLIVAGNPEYVEWILSETSNPTAGPPSNASEHS